jgi:hypothetical protein
MSNHFLKRNHDNEPICACGYRPDILNTGAPVGKQWKARTAVLDHVQALHACDDCTPDLPTPLRSPTDPFVIADAKYPRAGVRQTEDGRWLLSCWDGDQIVHVIEEPIFDDRVTAFDYAWLTIGACRDSGTNLNGWAA